MTKRLYYTDAYMTECRAVVARTETAGNRTAVILDRTCFYPTSGGQLHDTGTIAGIPVVDVVERDDDILHILENNEAPSGEVHCIIDRERRFDFMQQHTGQHILSQCLIELFDAETVSSSLGRESSTIDIGSGRFTDEQAKKAEDLANNWIHRNVPVHILFPDEAELAGMPLRKQPPPGKQVRIIHIEGLDFTPCGGTHCSRTGEAGPVKIIGREKMKGNIRLEFLCGRRAISDYRKKSRIMSVLCSLLSTGENDAAAAVERMIEDGKTEHKYIQELTAELTQYRAIELYDNAETAGDVRIISAVRELENVAGLQQLSQAVRALGPAVVLLGIDGEKPSFVFAHTGIAGVDLNETLRELKKDFELKGGGRPEMVQGGLAGRGTIGALLQKAKDILISVL